MRKHHDLFSGVYWLVGLPSLVERGEEEPEKHCRSDGQDRYFRDVHPL